MDVCVQRHRWRSGGRVWLLLAWNGGTAWKSSPLFRSGRISFMFTIFVYFCFRPVVLGIFFSCRQPDFWMIRCPFQKMVAFAFKPWPCPCISWKTHWWVPKVRFYEAAAGGPKMPLASVTGVANVPAMMGKYFVESSGYWGNVWTWLWQKMEVIPSTKDDVLDPA